MKVCELLNRRSILLHAEAQDVPQALDTLVNLQERGGVITNGTAYYNAVCERESVGGSTAIGDGMALPHASNAGVASLGIAVLRLQNGLDWGAYDAKPVDLIFMLAVPPHHESEHLLALARLVNLLSDAALVRKLRASDTPEDLIAVLTKAETARFA